MTTKARTVLTLAATTALMFAATLLLHGRSPQRLPPGTYTTTITAQEVPPSFPPEIAGTWEIEYIEGGVVIAWKDGDFVVRASFTSNPVRLVIHDTEGPLACVDPGTKTGVYDWSFQDNELTLSDIHDSCPGRAFVLTLHPLQKQ
jgi:hypothetical protein